MNQPQKTNIMSNQVATTILNQLGGRKFLAFTGSKNLIAGENFLTMKLARNSSGANYLKISLNAMDTYEIEFISIRSGAMKTKHEFNGIYNDQLVNIFETTTGLYTKF
jgi:hypothetical protein|tara:strand:+ start:1069 stop:1392 length:324 start_codon:yes stop_codon:yes gene_type:complete